MTKKWTVEHYYSNPSHNRTVECETKREALDEARRMSSDKRGNGASWVRNPDGKPVCTRDWASPRLDWNI